MTLMTEGNGLARGDRVLAVVPMFHANAWGLPYGAALAGADLILPDRFLGAEPLAKLIAAERPTLMGCVPTIFPDLLRYADEHPEVDLSSLTNAACGGSAVPKQLMKDFEERHGVRMFQAWGMTETSPVATYSRPQRGRRARRRLLGRARQAGPAAAVGRAAPRRRRRREVPWDGESTGEIEVRGPWIASQYFRDPDPDKFDDGWLRTGDIAAVDEKGYVQITDRSKDVIKSGGEWISSVELENELMAHPERGRGGGDRQAGRALGRAAAVLRGAARARTRPARRSSSSTCAAASRSGGCPTSSPSSRRSRRRAWASSTRRCCAGSSPKAASRVASRCPDPFG